jgi:hypothetical protein
LIRHPEDLESTGFRLVASKTAIRSKYFLEIVAGEFAISQDLSKEPAPNRLTAVHGYDCAPPVWMAQEMVAPSRAYHFKTKFQKGFDKLGPSH